LRFVPESTRRALKVPHHRLTDFHLKIGCTANCLHPGFVATRFGDRSGGVISRFVGLASKSLRIEVSRFADMGAWYLLRNKYHAEEHIMLGMGLFLAAVLVPIQLFFGHLTGDYVHEYQPPKFAAIEGRWHDEQPAGEVRIAIPDAAP
jgi:hypothetical protein